MNQKEELDLSFKKQTRMTFQKYGQKYYQRLK